MEAEMDHLSITVPPLNSTITQNGKGEKCYSHKDFDETKAKYKTWLRLLEAIRACEHIFPNDTHRINCALTYTSAGEAADWAEHFTNNYTSEDADGKVKFKPNMTWAAFVKLERPFDVKQTRISQSESDNIKTQT